MKTSILSTFGKTFSSSGSLCLGSIYHLNCYVGCSVYQSKDSPWNNGVKMNISSGLSQSQIFRVNMNLRGCTYTSLCAMFPHFKVHPNTVSSEIMKILLTKKIRMIHIPFKNNHRRHRGDNCFLFTILSMPEEWNHSIKAQTDIFEGDNHWDNKLLENQKKQIKIFIL